MNYCKWEKNGDISKNPYDKIVFYHRLEKYDIRVKPEDNSQYHKELEQQKKLHEYRVLPDVPLYGGPAWWSLTRECVEYMIGQSGFIERYYTDTLFPDESFAQTVIMNNPKLAPTVVNYDLRYICWETRNNSRPAVLDMSDLPGIVKDKDVFARKIAPDVSGQCGRYTQCHERNRDTFGFF